MKGFKALFWTLQIFTVGMLISFPLQGYGTFSIIFSALHTFGAFAFIWLFFAASNKVSSLALLLAKISLLFFILSSVGPFSLAYLKANGLEHSNLYRFSIYFYLHFQYNGFFFFGILALLLRLIEDRLSISDLKTLKTGAYFLIGTCIPCYVLSILWSEPGLSLTVIGLITALIQLIGLYLFIRPAFVAIATLHLNFPEKILFALSIVALIAKGILQLISAFPTAAILANEFRVIVIAYLHLVLLGFISFFLFGWLSRKKLIGHLDRSWVKLLIGSFWASEILLVISPWNDSLHLSTTDINLLLFVFSFLSVTAIGRILLTALTANT